MTLSFQLILVACGGAIGACSRYLLSGWANKEFAAVAVFPLGTLVVNVLGSMLMGLAYGAVIEKGLFDETLKPLFMAGFLGAFTTFSAYSLEAVLLFEQGHVLSGASYVVANVLLSLLLFAAGLWLIRVIF